MHENLEVGVEAGRGYIILPLLLSPIDCPLKWRLGDAIRVSLGQCGGWKRFY
jgi:hypothetical protein